jgi:hypothetical protein
MEQLGTVANRASALTVECAYLCSLFSQSVRGDHSILPDGMRPIVLQRDSSHATSATAVATASSDAAATPAPGDGATAAPPAAADPAATSLRPISINPGYAPVMVAQGGGVLNRFRMPAGLRSVSVSGNQGQMEVFMSPSTDPAAGEIIEEMLASGMMPGAQVLQPLPHLACRVPCLRFLARPVTAGIACSPQVRTVRALYATCECFS